MSSLDDQVQSSASPDSPARSLGPLWIGAALFVISVMALFLNAWRYWPFISDDALISLRYADRWLDGHGLTWTDGIPVEGYSNLLWIMLVTLVGLFGADLLAAARALGLVGMAGVVVALLSGYPIRGRRELWPVLIGLGFFVLAGSTGVWAIGGLETPLVAALLAWGLVSLFKAMESAPPSGRHLWTASILLGLICITRPDGPLLTAAVAVGWVVVRGLNKESYRTAGQIVLFSVLITLGQQIFRLIYYGEWLPNPALVKISPSWTHLQSGWDYMAGGFLSLLPFSAIAVLLTAVMLVSGRRLSKRYRDRIVILVVISLAWAAYVVFIGGDVFPAWRHFMPLLVTMALMLIEGARWLLARRMSSLTEVITLIIAAAGLVWFYQIQIHDPENRRAIDERWEFDGQVIGTMLKGGFSDQQPTVAVTAAGCIPYWSELPAIDMLGLNDYFLPRNLPETFGEGWIGHEIRDDQYVLDRNPDLIIFHMGGDWMVKMTQFYERYRLCHFEGREPYYYRTAIWVNKASDKVGVRSDDSSISVPGYLLNGNQTTTAYLNADGRFVIPVTGDQPAWLPELPLPPGRYRPELFSTAPLAVSMTALDKDTRTVVLDDAGLFTVSDSTVVRLDLAAGGGDSVEVERIVLHRLYQ